MMLKNQMTASRITPTISKEIIQSASSKSSQMRKSKTNINPNCKEVEEELLKYCRSGNLQQVEDLFDKFYKIPGFNINSVDNQGNSPLILASKLGHGRIVEFLLLYTPDITMENCRGDTVMHVAPKHIQKMILQASAPTNSNNQSVTTALCNACFLGNDVFVQRFVNDSLMRSPHMKNGFICNQNGIDCIFLPLRHTALLETISIKYKFSYHPHLVLQILLSHIYTPDPSLILLHIVASTPSKSASELTRVLLDKKFSPIATDHLGFTPIHYAARTGNTKVLEALLYKASFTETAQTFLDTPGNAGNTPLHLAAMEGKEESVKILLRYGANKDVVNSQGHTPKHSSRNNRVKLLLSPARNPNNPNQKYPNLRSSGMPTSQSALSLQRSNTTISQIALTNRPVTHRNASSVLAYPSRSSPSATNQPPDLLSHSLTQLDFGRPKKKLSNNLDDLPEVIIPPDGNIKPVSKSTEFLTTKRTLLKPISKSNTSSPEETKIINNNKNKEAPKLNPITTKNSKLPNLVRTNSDNKLFKSNKNNEDVITKPQAKRKIIKKKNVTKSKTTKNLSNADILDIYGSDFESDCDTLKDGSDYLEVKVDSAGDGTNMDTYRLSDDDDTEEMEEEDGDADEGEGEGDGDVFSKNNNNEIMLSDRKVSTFIDQSLIDFDNYQKGQLLGKGGYGMVYKVLLDDGRFCVMKEVAVKKADPLSEFNKGNTKEIQRETEILLTVKHENIVQCYGIDTGEGYVHIFMELVSGGTIADQLREFRFSERIIRNYTRQLVGAVNFLHTKGIVHRDIKGGNVMITSEGVVKLIDFGCAKKCHPLVNIDSWGSNRSGNEQSCHVGSIYWMAPELLRNEGQSNASQQHNAAGFKSDIWSIGCTVHEMVAGHPPNHDKSYFNLMYLICRNQLQMPSLIDYPLYNHQLLSQSGSNFVSSCFTWEPTTRPSSEDLLQMAFMKIS